MKRAKGVSNNKKDKAEHEQVKTEFIKTKISAN